MLFNLVINNDFFDKFIQKKTGVFNVRRYVSSQHYSISFYALIALHLINRLIAFIHFIDFFFGYLKNEKKNDNSNIAMVFHPKI